MEESLKKHVVLFIVIVLPIIAAILLGYIRIGPN